MDGMSMGETKVSVAIGIQLQVAVSDGANVMLSCHADREDKDERTRTLDLLHECAERLFNRYRMTALKSIISNKQTLLDQERVQMEKDEAHRAADAERRAGEINAVRTDDAAAWGADNRRGEYKPNPAAVRKVELLEREQEKANEQFAQQKEISATNIRKLERDIAVDTAELQHLERLLNGANG